MEKKSAFGDDFMKIAGQNDDSGIERGSGIAVWRQLAGRLRDDIAKGRLSASDRLPTEATLAERFSVNRHTVRRAIGVLAEQGLVRVEQGRGAFVEDVMIDYPLGERTSFSANLLAQGREPDHAIIDVETIGASDHLAARLRVRRGAKLVKSRAIGLADGTPLSVGESHFPSARFPGIAEKLTETRSISKTLAQFGVKDYRRQETRILTRMPTADEARNLKQPISLPVLVTEALDVDPTGEPIRVGQTCFASARVHITVGPERP